MSKTNRIPILSSLSALIIGGLVYFSSDHVDHEVQAVEAPKSSATEEIVVERETIEPGKVEAGTEAIAEVDHPDDAMPTVIVPPAMAPLRRGANNRLLLEEAVTIERHANPESVSPEIVFSLRNREIQGPLTIDEHTLSAVEATVDVAALASFLESNDGAIRIPVSRDKEVLATFDRVITRGEHTSTLIGQVVDDSFSDILLVFHDGAVSGSVAFHDTNTHYQFAMAGNGDVAIRNLDSHSFEAGCGNPDHLAADLASDAEDGSEDDESEGEILQAPAGATPFDAVVGYSAEARISDGGTAAIEARIIGSVDRMNTALSNSKSGDWFCSLLAMIEDPDASFSDSNYSDMAAILTDLNQTTDGVLDAVTDMKVELGADQATFVCNAPIAGTSGIAYRPGVYCITARTYMSSTRLVFAHEVGHNLGLRHGWGDSGTASTNPKDQSNYGWRFRTSNGTKVRTIMAYSASWGGSRINYFANPNVDYNGAPTGTARGFDATDTSGTPAYDQLFVLNGSVGGLGAGFDGTNSKLGARNGDYLKYNSGTLANKDKREALAVLEPAAGTQFIPGASTTIYWHGGDHTDTVQIDLYKGGVFQSTIASGLSGEDRWHDWTVPNITDGNDYAIRVALSGSTADDSGTFTIYTPIVNVPYVESFESGFGAWAQSAGDDFDWTRNSGGTPTANTGPAGASEGSWYLYIEGNDIYDGHNKVAQIDCVFDLSTVSAAELSFDYHMYGANIDYLAVDVHDGSTWTTDVLKRIDAQHSSNSDPWSNAVVDLSAYAGKNEVTIRFRAKEDYWHISDIAIDNIVVDERQTLPYAESFEDGMGAWAQSTDDDYDWTVHTGGTETPAAGPAGASDGSYYLYAEGHHGLGSDKTAFVHCSFDLSTVDEVELTFDYHMYGAFIDYLAVDIHDGTGWTNDVWIKDGPQHFSSSDPWSMATVDLSAYAGNSDVTVRFRTANTLWNAADPAIDNIRIFEPVGPLVAHWSMDDGSGTVVTDDEGNGFDATMSGASWVSGIVGPALQFNGSSSTVSLPASAFFTVRNEITLSMWVYGGDMQPRQDSVFYAENATGDRVLNVHLPWDDGNVYWDAGFDGTFDRIDKLASSNEYKGQWNHWVFTKNATTGDMAAYLNGTLWHSDTGMTRSMAGITAVKLGSQINGKNYSGVIDDVRLYNKSLDATEVSDLFSSYTTSDGVPFGWLMGHGIDPSDAGAQANTDADKQINGVEWVFGTDPLVTDSPIKTLSSDGSVMSITYTRRKVDDASVYAEWSTDMTELSWGTTGLSEVVTDDDGEIETVTVTIPMDSNQKFIRIKVDR